jgi:rRNA maturation RNase YbeY
VLSFPQQGAKQFRELKALDRKHQLGAWPLGDVVISLERARAQAEEKGVKFRDELALLLVHGILHLLGFDHELSEREARRMRRWELRLLRR